MSRLHLGTSAYGLNKFEGRNDCKLRETVNTVAPHNVGYRCKQSRSLATRRTARGREAPAEERALPAE